jgi:hypothetical protein
MAAGNLAHIGGFNGYLPTLTGQVISYARKTENFKLNEYIQYVPTKKTNGVYVQLGVDAFVRAVTDEEDAWEDGDDRTQMGEYNKIPYTMIPFRTMRRNTAWQLGQKAIEETDAFRLKPAHVDMATSIRMTKRTKKVIDYLQTVGNWPTTNTATANTLNGGKGTWDLGSADPTSANYLGIYLTLVNVAQRINLATNARVKPTDLRFILSPAAAIKTAAAPEMVDYVRNTPYSREVMEKGFDPQYQMWGLPSTYKGFTFIVEDAPIVTERESTTAGVINEATTNRGRIKNDTTCICVARPGSLDGEYGALGNFSTVQIYHYGGLLEVEAFTDAENRRIRGHVSDDVFVALASAISGFLIQTIL